MNERTRPPNRRPCWKLKFSWETETGAVFRFFGTISYFGSWEKPDLNRPMEVFINSSRTTTTMSIMASEAAILVSHALQRGATVEELLEAVPKVPHPLKGEIPATPIGTLLELIAEGRFIPEELQGLAETGPGRPVAPLELSRDPESDPAA
jgi:hypothetical protein